MKAAMRAIILINILTIFCWVGNLVALAEQDFESPYKSEVVHGIGVVIPWASIITVFYNED